MSWQFTKWGMTPEEVAEASPQRLRDATRDSGIGPEAGQESQTGQVALLSGTWMSGELEFTSFFLFDAARRLASINLLLSDTSQASWLGAALAQKYGGPEKEVQIDGVCEILTWRTLEETIVYFRFLNGEDPCAVSYVAVNSLANEGL